MEAQVIEDRGKISPLQAQRNKEREDLQQMEMAIKGRVAEIERKYPIIPIPRMVDPFQCN